MNHFGTLNDKLEARLQILDLSEIQKTSRSHQRQPAIFFTKSLIEGFQKILNKFPMHFGGALTE